MHHRAYKLTQPLRQTTSVVFSSPHSGRDYSYYFQSQSRLDPLMLRSSEDAYVDRLFESAPLAGAPLIAATAPRAWLDLNRGADELDPALVEDVARVPHNPRISSGLGVIPRVVAGGRTIYQGRLSRAEADARLTDVWYPYHAGLRALMDASHAQFGEAVLIDCHSMPHEAIEAHCRVGNRPPEIVLGDRYGATAGRTIMDRVEAAFVSAGFRVARNTPFAGAYIAQAYGRPTRGQHVVQVEIDRALYLDEARVEPLAEFAAFQMRLAGVIAEITDIGRSDSSLAAE
jgi:N-formylglutamate amidohydrolase